jgi:hypothetical protein
MSLIMMHWHVALGLVCVHGSSYCTWWLSISMLVCSRRMHDDGHDDASRCPSRRSQNTLERVLAMSSTKYLM